MPALPLTLPAALNLLLWMAAYTPTKRNTMFATLPSEAKQNFIENDHELFAQHSFPHRECPKFEDTMSYVRTQLSTGDNWTEGHWEFMNALSKGAQVAVAKCNGDSPGNLPWFWNPDTFESVPQPFIRYLRLKGFSLQQSVEIFQVFSEENQDCIRALKTEDNWRDVPHQIKSCLDKFDVFLSTEWKAEMWFLTEIMNGDIVHRK